MTDMRRILLWGVFVMSLVLLWDAWSKHTGAPSLFGGTPQRPAAAASGGQPTVPTAALPAPVPNPQGATPTAATPMADATPTGEQVTVTTDVYKATFDSRGGSLTRLELVKYADAHDTAHPVMLFDQSRATCVFGAERPDRRPAGRHAAQPPHDDDGVAGRTHVAGTLPPR